MRSVNTDSAAFPDGGEWDQVDWPIVHRRVRGLPGCGQLIDDEDQWLIKPVVPIKAGGARSLANLKMLHSTCQRRFRIVNGKSSASDTRVPAP
jgi:hypothetical protein